MHRFGEQTCGRWYLHREGQCNGRPRADRFRGGTGTPLSCQHAGKAWAVTGGCDSFQRLRGSRGPPLRRNGGRLRIDDGESDVLEIRFFFYFSSFDACFVGVVAPPVVLGRYGCCTGKLELPCQSVDGRPRFVRRLNVSGRALE